MNAGRFIGIEEKVAKLFSKKATKFLAQKYLPTTINLLLVQSLMLESHNASTLKNPHKKKLKNHSNTKHYIAYNVQFTNLIIYLLSIDNEDI